MTIKQQINHGDIQKVCHTLPTLLHHLPYFIKNIKLWDEKNEDFCIYGCLRVSHYIEGGRKITLNKITFLDSVNNHVIVYRNTWLGN